MEEAVRFLLNDTACGTPVRWWVLDAEATMEAWSVRDNVDAFWDAFWSGFSKIM